MAKTLPCPTTVPSMIPTVIGSVTGIFRALSTNSKRAYVIHVADATPMPNFDLVVLSLFQKRMSINVTNLTLF
jgi:hypothetical protein